MINITFQYQSYHNIRVFRLKNRSILLFVIALGYYKGIHDRSVRFLLDNKHILKTGHLQDLLNAVVHIADDNGIPFRKFLADLEQNTKSGR